MQQVPLTRHLIDDTTYDLLVVISSKLEAMHVYERFASDGDQDRALCERLRRDDARHVDLLVEALRERLGTSHRYPGPRATEPAGDDVAELADTQLRSAGAFDWVADRR